jgi:hypothetical protein
MSNIKFTKYNPATGEITCTGSASAGKIAVMSSYILGEYPGEWYCVTDGLAELKATGVINQQNLNKSRHISLSKRNSLLLASDKYMIPDFPTDLRPEWQAYRQALRDLPEQPDWPESEFPVTPE